MTEEEAARAVHEAIGGLLGEGELAICWTLTIDVAGANGRRYLAHRAGGGHDGTERPMAWAALGMLEASALSAREFLKEITGDHPPRDDDEGPGE